MERTTAVQPTIVRAFELAVILEGTGTNLSLGRGGHG